MGAEWGLKTDIWSVGCLAFELATARMLMPVGNQEDRKLLNFMICRLGMPPMALRRAGAHAATHFASNGGRRDKTELTKLSIKAEKILSEGRNFFSTRQAIEFCDFINKSSISTSSCGPTLPPASTTTSSKAHRIVNYLQE
ncbi:hypothetical protein L596_018015 [Steinernema carpocapsae]|uniref:Protein kinase domain-containing protein n=1 Tax=Steinernema carpocapsae TaxID=34508 RepID=A0A4U5N3P3_STECR|nr:hypothetical protein L596_018015 [Steinernema carpocapsae]